VFRALPAWIETDHIRIVHACWHHDSQESLIAAGNVGGRFSSKGLIEALTRGTEAYRAADILLKGPEVSLPDGVTFRDTDGAVRRQARVQWWHRHATSLRTAAIGVPELAMQLPDTELADLAYRYDDPKLVFFGHYSLAGEPNLDSTAAMCLDYSIAKGGALVAYRWSGESALTLDNVEQVR
jgi:hypothetical protein